MIEKIYGKFLFEYLSYFQNFGFMRIAAAMFFKAATIGARINTLSLKESTNRLSLSIGVSCIEVFFC